jgi:hypothetical protein
VKISTYNLYAPIIIILDTWGAFSSRDLVASATKGLVRRYAVLFENA